MGRVPGTCGDNFSVDKLVADLQPWANLKKCPFDWELQRYAKSRKSQGPDRAGLHFYAPLLSVVLKHAPHGYPSVVLLKMVWKELEAQHKIMHPELRKNKADRIDVWTSDCVDKICIALKHVVDLKKTNTIYVTKEVQQLMDLVSLRSSGSSASLIPEPQAAAGAATTAPAALPDHISLSQSSSESSSLIFCGVDCQCPACKQVQTIDGSDGDLSDTSVAARDNVEIVPAIRGGQKRAAKADDEDENVPGDAADASAKKKPKLTKKDAASQRKPKSDAASVKKPKSKDPIFPDHEPPSMSSSSSSVQPPKPRVKIVQRYNPPEKKSAYIMYNDVHLVGCSLKASSQYQNVLEIMKKELIDGSFIFL